ncbi:hypothetical protein J5Y09_14140 [Roseomonas sp. PWR1]|uniref:Immunity MXAN-0049 protein domain-containing protein n=1 Tax=Roseomonas nitratireducens TaxID=2820810 RepID=A0ABS4AUM7_9PROT|nr:DUF1629 domain-containing protein [Neoroseomonas nitratireducens]MBP0465060.1 hypothetical protein [Neoroseomonas nitratireducens]
MLTDAAYQRSKFLGFDFGNKGIRFDPADVKTEFWLTSKHQALADFLPVVACWGVSVEFRAVVEHFESGLHQFFPIMIRRPNGKPIERLDGRDVAPGQYFIMNPLVRINSLLPEECIGKQGQRRKTLNDVVKYVDDLCVSRTEIAGRHLWVDAYFSGGGELFVSDALLAALRAKELKGFLMQKVREA